MSIQRVIRLVIAVLASLVSMALSWPYFRDFEYWAESQTMWLIYFIVGFLLAVYVFMVFIDALATLFEHDTILKQGGMILPDEADAPGKGDQS